MSEVTPRIPFRLPLLCFLLLLAAVAPAGAQVTEVFRGFLCIVACGTAGYDPAGDDLTMSPGKHTVACMKECSYTAASASS
jgi:hypothetical protein